MSSPTDLPAEDGNSSLHQALTASLAYAASYPVRRMLLSNHLPMVMTALHRLKAPVATMWTQFERIAPRLAPLAPDSPEADTARRHAQALAEDGRSAVLARYLPALLLASESSSFHGLIRVAYAIDAGHPGELAHALAGWTYRLEFLGPPLSDAVPVGLPTIAAALGEAMNVEAFDFSAPPESTITDDMQACAAMPGFDEFVIGARAPSDAALTLDAFAEASLAAYLASRDFVALHLVTACHALRLVLPHARLSPEQTRTVMRGFWRAWLAAWVSCGRPAPDWVAVRLGPAAVEAHWADALPTLTAQGDDHQIKLAWTALAEWRFRGWPGYARVLPASPAVAANPRPQP
ncbi:questin oxidase family protein [Ideonella sp. DXS29W]|uniref:Questin oxidase family protein n=1 Tax=Ideonella lacteola TaxID=2984193 RepID=A0ABU9BXQ2_9BURK